MSPTQTFFEDLLKDLPKYISDTLLNFLAVTIFLMIVFAIYKTFEKSKWCVSVKKKFKYNESIINFILGALASTGSFFYYSQVDWYLSFFIFMFLILVFYFNYQIVIGAVPILLTNAILTYLNANVSAVDNVDVYLMITNATSIGLILLFSIVFRFAHLKNNNLVIFSSILIIVGAVAAILMPLNILDVLGETTNYNKFAFNMQFVVLLIICFLSFGVVRPLWKFIRKTEKLGENVLYNNGFIIEKFADSQINEFLKTKKIRFAYIMKFSIIGLESAISKYGASLVTDLKKYVMQLIKAELSIYDALFYLQNDNAEYFAIIPIKNINDIKLDVMIAGNQKIQREDNDDLKFLDSAMDKVVSKYEAETKAKNVFGILVYTTIYGINSDDFWDINKTLTSYNINYVTLNQNQVYLINMTYMKSMEVLTKNKILHELNMFSPNDIVVDILKENKHRLFGYNLYTYSAFYLQQFLLDKNEIWSLSENRVVQSAIICHLSAKAIRNYVAAGLDSTNNLLIVDYPQYLIEQADFNVMQLMSNINSYEMDAQNIILNIQIDVFVFSEAFFKNLQRLLDNNFKLAFTNLPKKDLKHFKRFDGYFYEFANN